MQILNALAVTTAITGTVVGGPVQIFQDGSDIPRTVSLEASFTYGSGGTTADYWVQTSLDGGNTWIDVANFHFALASAKFVYNLSSLTAVGTEYTPTDGTLTANTSKDGILGSLWRVKSTTVGTYAGGTTISISLNAVQ